MTQKEMQARRFAIMPRKLWLYRDGDECVGVTGGWRLFGQNNQRVSASRSFNKYSNSLDFMVSTTYDMAWGSITHTKPVDISNYKNLCVEYSYSGGTGRLKPYMRFILSQSVTNVTAGDGSDVYKTAYGTDSVIIKKSEKSTNRIIEKFEIAADNMKYFNINLFQYVNGGGWSHIIVYNVWLE